MLHAQGMRPVPVSRMTLSLCIRKHIDAVAKAKLPIHIAQLVEELSRIVRLLEVSLPILYGIDGFLEQSSRIVNLRFMLVLEFRAA